LTSARLILPPDDTNGDDTSDILFRNTQTGDVRLWEMNGASIAVDATVASGVPLNWTISGVGDFNGDGDADILWRNTSTGEADTWFINNGQPHARTPPSTLLT